jgi:hypothetical protein
MDPLVNELIEMERTGISFKYKNESLSMKGRVSAVCGDNLGFIHELYLLFLNLKSRFSIEFRSSRVLRTY